MGGGILGLLDGIHYCHSTEPARCDMIQAGKRDAPSFGKVELRQDVMYRC